MNDSPPSSEPDASAHSSPTQAKTPPLRIRRSQTQANSPVMARRPTPVSARPIATAAPARRIKRSSPSPMSSTIDRSRTERHDSPDLPPSIPEDSASRIRTIPAGDSLLKIVFFDAAIAVVALSFMVLSLVHR